MAVLRFMQWYLKKYGLDVGKKKKAAAQKEEKQAVSRTGMISWTRDIVSLNFRGTGGQGTGI